jgi:hypothetical protein
VREWPDFGMRRRRWCDFKGEDSLLFRMERAVGAAVLIRLQGSGNFVKRDVGFDFTQLRTEVLSAALGAFCDGSDQRCGWRS